MFCPEKKIVKTQKNKPWLSDDLRALIKEKNKIHNKFLRKPITFGPQYRSLRNQVNNCIKIKKKKYYENILLKHQGNSKRIWSILNDLLGRNKREKDFSLEVNGELTDNPKVIVEEFNNYFSNVTTEIVQSLPNSNYSFHTFMNPSHSQYFNLSPVSPFQIEKIIKDMKDTSGGHLNIPSKVFKAHSSLLSVPLSALINRCIESGSFPECLKVAQVLPLFKAKNRLDVKNFRPISLLPLVAKIFEKFIYDQLIEYVECNDLLCHQQSGFRRNSSTSISIAKLLDKVISGADEGNFGLCVFLDMQKAFDMVDHEILIKKLEYYGIRGTPLNLFKSYLTNRKQFVQLNRVSSKFSNICRGVPQGSTLSGLLFLLFINDIVNSSDKLFFNLFADDTSIYLNNANLNNLYDVMNEELVKVGNWLSANKLSLNVSKTTYILFKGKKKSGIHLNYTFSAIQFQK